MRPLIQWTHRLVRVSSQQACSENSLASLCWVFLQALGKRQRTQRLIRSILAELIADLKTPGKNTAAHGRKVFLILAARHRFSLQEREKWGRNPLPFWKPQRRTRRAERGMISVLNSRLCPLHLAIQKQRPLCSRRRCW